MINEENEFNLMVEVSAIDELPEILPITEDGVFQAALTQVEALPGLCDMAECFGEIKADRVELLPSEPNTPDKDVKSIIYDVRFVAHVGEEQFNFEMQASHMLGDNIANDHENLNARMTYNLSVLHSRLNRRKEYGDYPRSFQITFCNYRLDRDEHDMVDWYSMRNVHGKLLDNRLNAIKIDLTLAKDLLEKPVTEMTGKEKWVIYLAYSNDLKHSKLVSEIKTSREAIKMVDTALRNVSQNEAQRQAYINRIIANNDRAHEMAYAKRKGKEESDEYWAPQLAEKDDALAERDAKLAEYEKRFGKLG